MKKNFFKSFTRGAALGWDIRRTGNRVFFVLAFILIGLIDSAPASVDLDRQFKLETIGYLKAWDNIDGLFADYIANAYETYFAHQTRFTLNDLSRAMQILNTSKLPYAKIIQDPDILRQLTRSTHTESLIRTLISKEGSSYVFTLDWLYAPKMILLGSTQFTMEEPRGGTGFSSEEIVQVVSKNLDDLIAKFPFLGQVTGRDTKSIIINLGHLGDLGSLGKHAKLHKGDVLSIVTLEEVKVHPLLNKIVDWHSVPTGQAIVDQVEDAIAFAKITEEMPNESIAKYQKITFVRNNSPTIEGIPVEILTEPEPVGPPPQTGWIGGTLLLGSYSRDFSSMSGTMVGSGANSGGALALGARGEAQLWLTKTWFTDIEFGYTFGSFSQTDDWTGLQTPTTQNGGVSSTLSTFKLDLGYNYLFNDDPLGPKVYAKFGYKSNSYSLPVSLTEGTGPISFSSIFFGLGGDLPLNAKWGILGHFNFRFLPFVSQPWLADSVDSSSDVEIFFGGYYNFRPRIVIRAGIDVISSGATFSTTGSNLSQKTVTFAPALLYYF